MPRRTDRPLEIERPAPETPTIGQRLKRFLNPFDARYEDMRSGKW